MKKVLIGAGLGASGLALAAGLALRWLVNYGPSD